MSKSIFASKTFWLNMVVLVPLLVQWASGHHWIPDADAAMILAAANIIIRTMTNQPVTIPGIKGPNAQGAGNTLNVGG